MNYARFALTTLLVSLTIISSGFASDHDDGENDNKSRSLNLTDLYVFREDKEISGGDANHLVFLMNSNPRSLPQQQYYFSTKARYEIHVSRVGTSKDVPISTDDDIIMRFTFGAPDATGKQAITFATIIDGVTTSKTLDDSSALLTTTPFAPVVLTAPV